MTLYVLTGTGLIGVTTSKSMGCRARRNRTKRRVREIARLQFSRFQKFDTVIVARNSAEKAPFAELECNLGELMDELEQRWEKQLESS